MLSFNPTVVDIVLIIAVSVLITLHIIEYRATKKEAFSKNRNAEPSTESVESHTRIRRLLPNLASLSLIASGSIILLWVGWLTWYDITTWGKDIAFIFFGSRTSEAIGLGIGMIVLDYFLIGLTLPLAGYIIFLRRHRLS